jgi:hypothetical protein
MANPINTHDFIMPIGTHRGERITRVPLGYLRWMVNERTQLAPYAQAELERRGSAELPKIEVTTHALDRASYFLMELWATDRRKNEGFASWLTRMATEALGAPIDNEGRHLYMGRKWVFEKEKVWPVLKTVTPSKSDKKKLFPTAKDQDDHSNDNQ